MTNWHIGMKVRVTKNSPSSQQGRVGKVIKVRPGNERDLRVDVKFSEDRFSWVFAPYELEVVQA